MYKTALAYFSSRSAESAERKPSSTSVFGTVCSEGIKSSSLTDADTTGDGLTDNSSVSDDDEVEKLKVRYGNKFYDGYNYDSTSIRRPFDCLSNVIKVTVT